MIETELKLVIDEVAARAIWPRAVAAGLIAAAPRPRLLKSIYYDTPDHALRRAGIALRLRRDGRRWIQTVKLKSAIHGGLSRAGEWEARAPGGRLNPALIGDDALREEVLRLGEEGLAPICETTMRRAAGVLGGPDGAKVELAVDQGEITAAGRALAFREMELEAIEGPVAGVFDLALLLLPEGGVRFSHRSKSERGYLLADGCDPAPKPAPRRARRVALSAEATSESAARGMLRECVGQIAANIEATRALDEPAGPHQLRIGLRRLRTAFSLFAPALRSPEATRLAEEARWLAAAAAVGELRDLEVARGDIIEPAGAAHPQEAGFRILAAALSEAEAPMRISLREMLDGKRVQAFLLHLARFTECRGWLLSDDIAQTERLARPAPKLARAALEKTWRKVEIRARGLDGLGVEERHELRKSLKKLRYAVDFLRPLYPKKKVKEYLKKLKLLQDIFGDLNDVEMAAALFTGPEALGADDPASQRAVGWILGSKSTGAEIAWARASRLWRDLAEAKPFWR
ncbi:MAG: CHAD domain-containing protein [Paracoccaceae bacterium]